MNPNSLNFGFIMSNCIKMWKSLLPPILLRIFDKVLCSLTLNVLRCYQVMYYVLTWSNNNFLCFMNI